jgi:hypothetical protein
VNIQFCVRPSFHDTREGAEVVGQLLLQVQGDHVLEAETGGVPPEGFEAVGEQLAPGGLASARGAVEQAHRAGSAV